MSSGLIEHSAHQVWADTLMLALPPHWSNVPCWPVCQRECVFGLAVNGAEAAVQQAAGQQAAVHQAAAHQAWGGATLVCGCAYLYLGRMYGCTPGGPFASEHACLFRLGIPLAACMRLPVKRIKLTCSRVTCMFMNGRHAAMDRHGHAKTRMHMHARSECHAAVRHSLPAWCMVPPPPAAPGSKADGFIA